MLFISILSLPIVSALTKILRPALTNQNSDLLIVARANPCVVIRYIFLTYNLLLLFPRVLLEFQWTSWLFWSWLWQSTPGARPSLIWITSPPSLHPALWKVSAEQLSRQRWLPTLPRQVYPPPLEWVPPPHFFSDNCITIADQWLSAKLVSGS